MYKVYFYPLFGDPQLIGEFADYNVACIACYAHPAYEEDDDDANEDSFHVFGPKGNELFDPLGAG